MLEEVLRTTFFDNAAALECQLAAVCLTLRGASIVRAFITVGPGGVGQSLNTCLIANLIGGSHGFMDLNVFFSEDELRKHSDTFTGKVNIRGSHMFTTSDMKTLVVLFSSVESGPPCVPQVVTTGQEAPSTDKWLRKDLYKKVMSGDPVAAIRHLDEDGHIFGLEEIRDERNSQVPQGYGNDVPVDYETISHQQLYGEVG